MGGAGYGCGLGETIAASSRTQAAGRAAIAHFQTAVTCLDFTVSKRVSLLALFIVLLEQIKNVAVFHYRISFLSFYSSEAGNC